MAQYKFSASRLLRFGKKENPSLADWRQLVHGFGDDLGICPELLPFIVKPDSSASIPYEQLNILPETLSQMTQKVGEMWVLFCFADSFDKSISAESPLRRDGFVLILEWRKGEPDSPLLATSFHKLARLVRQQLGVEGWGLWPAENRYKDKVDFTDPDLFADADNADQVASAYGALLAGLYCVSSPRYPKSWPKVWPFPSIKWDDETKRIAGVGGIEKKLSVAVDCGASSMLVVNSQKRRIEKRINKGRIEVCGIGEITDYRKLANGIAYFIGKFRRLVKRFVILLSGFVFIVGLIVAFLLFDETRTIYKFYEDVTESFGLPVGVGEIAKEDVAKCFRCYRFEYKGYFDGDCVHKYGAVLGMFSKYRKLNRVVLVNHKGYPFVADFLFKDNKHPIQEFEYVFDKKLKANRLAQIIERSRGGVDFISGPIVKRRHFASEGGGTNNFERMTCENESEPYYLQQRPEDEYERKDPESPYCPISGFKYSRGDCGFPSETRYIDARGELSAGMEGVFGFLSFYNDVGKPTREINIDRSATDKGVVEKLAKYGDYETTVEHLSIDGTLIAGNEGWARLVTTKDKYGNPVSVRYYDAMAKLMSCVDREGGCLDFTTGSMDFAIIDGHVSSVNYIGTDGSVLSGYNIEYDEFGDPTCYSYYGEDGLPSPSRDGVCVLKLIRNHQTGNATNIACYAFDGFSPAYAKELGVSQIRKEYDSNGHVIMEEYCDATGALMSPKKGDGAARIVLEWVGHHLKSQTEYDTRLTPITRTLYDYSKGNGNVTWTCNQVYDGTNFILNGVTGSYLSKYDDCGRIVEYRVCDSEKNDLMFTNLGSRITYSYSKIKPGVEFFPGKYSNNGYSSMTVKTYVMNENSERENSRVCHVFDEHGNRILLAFLDSKGRAICSGEGGVAAIEYEWDLRGNNKRTSYLNTNGLKMVSHEGNVAELRRSFDELNRVTNVCFYSENCEPVRYGNDRYSEERTEYDDKRNSVKISLWHNDEPVIGNCGFHILLRHYNEAGLEDETIAFDNKMNKTSYLFAGNYYMERKSYDKYWRVSSGSYFYPDNRIVSFTNSYDSLHRMIRHSLYGGKMYEDGGAECMELQYYGNSDSVSQKVLMTASGDGLFGCPAVRKRIEKFDAGGRSIEVEFFDGHDVSVPFRTNVREDGIFSLKCEYFLDGKMKRQEYDMVYSGVSEGAEAQKMAVNLRAGERYSRIDEYNTKGESIRTIIKDSKGNAIYERNEDAKFEHTNLSLVTNVRAGLPAESLGVRNGDLICRIDDGDHVYDILTCTNINDMVKSIPVVLRETFNHKKRLVIARPVCGLNFEILEYRFPEKLMGFNIEDWQCEDGTLVGNAVRNAYKRWQFDAANETRRREMLNKNLE